mmetsp:Transcript_71660/g.202581  ORF Transcript_71660/g.202581 Transcript_71660/m.202581 type:complete len:191 (-) Transcript_71660:1559-2131(-)
MSSIQRWFKDFSEPREASLTTGHSLSDAPQPDSTSSSSKSGSNCSAVMPELPRPVQKMVDSKVVKFTAYLIDFCWFVWFVVVAVCLVSLSNADFSDSSPTVGSNKANSTSTAGSNKANSTSTASSSRTTKLNVEVREPNCSTIKTVQYHINVATGDPDTRVDQRVCNGRMGRRTHTHGQSHAHVHTRRPT